MVVRLPGLYNLLINGVCWGELTHLLTIDPNFLGHPSGRGDHTQQKHIAWMFNTSPLKRLQRAPFKEAGSSSSPIIPKGLLLLKCRGVTTWVT